MFCFCTVGICDSSVMHMSFFICREHQSLCKYRDAKTAREMILNELKKVIEANPVLDGKLRFPELQRNRLRRMVNQRLMSTSFPIICFIS